MTKWNSDKAEQFIDSIEDPISKQFLRLFYSSTMFFVAQKKGYPEFDFDLFFFVRVIHSVVQEKDLLRMCLDGKKLDEGWEAIADVFSEPGNK